MGIHGYLVIANSLLSAPIPGEVKVEGIDIHHWTGEKFGIDDARKLTDQSSRKPVTSEQHCFVIVAKSITLEAQNALLKLFEEPPTQTLFYLVIPHESILLPTLRSRFVGKIVAEVVVGERAKEFLRQSLKERLELIADLAKKDPAALESLVMEIGQNEDLNLSHTGKRSLLLTEEYVYNRGASRKALLEELALSLPIIKG